MTSAEEFNCILCKETFDNKDELQIHFRKHGDPKFNESIKTKNRGQNETALANEKSNDASEMVNCDVCDEVFPTISKAITHKHKVHPEHDAKYFCPWCGKLFTMKHLYNKHLQINHDAAEKAPENEETHFRCDTCNVYFFIPAAMVYHNKFFHRQDTDLPIIGHSKKQKLFNQDLLPVYYCSFCGEEYVNKVNLHKHMCDDHGDENQRPTDVLRCPLCEAIFYHLDAYELHLTFHSSEDLYCETNEMNEKEMSEFSLETVPPSLERIEDLNNLPDVDTNVNAIGIESFLQMAMDEPKDQLPEKVKSKKHKKHKKSKKPAITLDEFLSMNQDVFGEDLDFQGIEEVPTKVITKQFKVKKPPVLKTGTKLVSSADLQKLQKQGIVVKVPSGNKAALSHIKQVGQPIKVNPQVKSHAIQTKRKTISASDEVLSKLLNQSSNQLKIVKKPAQEQAHKDEPGANESMTNNLADKIENKDVVGTETACGCMETNGDENEKLNNNHEANITPVSSPQRSPINNQDNEDLNVEKTYTSVTDRDDETENGYVNVNSNESNKFHLNQIQSRSFNQNVPASNVMNDTLKNIGKNITIKPITQPAIKSRIEEKPDETDKQKVKNIDVEQDHISSNIKLNTEQNVKSLDALKNLNSAITIKSLKTVGVSGTSKNSNTTIEETKIVSPNNPESCPIPQLKVENTPNKCDNNKDKPAHITPSSQVLRNISKNITIKSMSPKVRQSKEDVRSDENDFDNYDDGKQIEHNNSAVSSTPDRLKHVNSSHKLSPDGRTKSTCHSPYAIKPPVTDIEEKVSEDETCVKDKEFKNTNLQSSNNLLKHLKNITAKPVNISKSINQELTAKSSHVIKEDSVIKKTKEISQDIEIFNIDDSDDEVELPKTDKKDATPVKLEPTKPDFKSQAALNAIKNISKNITVKSSTNSQVMKEICKINESNADPFADEDEMQNDAEYDSNDDFEDQLTSQFNNYIPNQRDTIKNKDGSLKRVLENLGKHITVKSGNASPIPLLKSLDHSSQDYHRNSTANDTDSDDEYYSGKVKITEITKEDEDHFDQPDDCDNTGIVTQSPEDSNSGDEQGAKRIEEKEECENLNVNIRLNQNFKPTSEGLLKNISKNITIKSLSEITTEDKSCKTELPENDLIANQSKLCKDLLIKPIKQNKPDEGTKTLNMPNVKRMDGTTYQSPNVQPKQAKPGVLNTVNKEVKVKTFQSETVIEEITTTVTKTIRRVNQTVNQQVINASQISPTPRMIRPKIGPRMGGVQSNNVHGVTVRQATPMSVRPKIRHAIPFRPPASGTIVRPSNQLVPIRPSVSQIRPNTTPRMPIKSMPRQQRPVSKPLKISPNVVNHNLKRPGNDEPTGHFSCFKKPKESLIPGNDTPIEPGADFHYASSSQTSKFCSTTQTIKGNSVTTSTQMKSESLSQQQQINRLGNVSGLKIAKTCQVSQVERTETNASKRTTLEAIEKLQKQGLLVKKPRIEEDSDPPNSGGEDNEEFNDDEYDE